MKVITTNIYQKMQNRNKYIGNYAQKQAKQSEENFEEYLKSSCIKIKEVKNECRINTNLKIHALVIKNIQYHQRGM